MKTKMLILMILLSPFFVFAQESEEASDLTVDNEWTSPEPVDTGVNCFDYYTFQSVSVAVSPDKNLYQPGEVVHFSGNITNENSYPVVDGNLFVRISEENENFITEGRYVIDEFFALENISLDSNSSKNVSFEWSVPVEVSKGNYHVDYFFSVGKKFNLGGLPFSNEVVGGISAFEVDSVYDGYFSFDRNGTTINGDAYVHIGDWPFVEKNSEVTVVHNIKNTFDYAIDATITFDLYFWDSLLEEDKRNTEEFVIVVPAGGSKEVTYTIPQAQESVYYLKTTAKKDDLQSIVNTRFVTDGGEQARLNYPAVTKFPIKKGDDFTIFTCFHNTTYAATEGSVSVSLFDKEGNEIAKEIYEGHISSVMNVIKKDVKAEADYEHLMLKAEVRDAKGNIIDHYETEYSCEDVGGCVETGAVASAMSQSFAMKLAVYGVLAIICIVVVIVIIKVVKGRGGVVSIFFLVLLIGGMYGFCDHVHAGTWSTNSSKSYTHGAKKADHDNSTIFQYTVASGTVILQNSITGNDSAVCEGSVTYSYTPTLVFSANGGSWDTPYGAICNALNCFSSSQSQSITDAARSLPGTIKWISQKPTVTLSSSNNAIMSCSGMVCTAQPGQSGTVTITADFSNVSSQIKSYIKRRPCHELGDPCVCGAARYDFWSYPSDDAYGVASGCIGGGYHSRMYYDGSWHNGTNRMSLGASTVSWDVTVGSCAQDGACNPAATKNDYAYTATGPSTPLCSAGTVPTTTPLFPAGKYGVDSEVTWTCGGTGGGSDSSVCRAQRQAPPACTCDPGTNDQVFSYLQTSWPAAFCAAGSVVGAEPSFPISGGPSVTWQCGGPTCSGDVANCSASRGTPLPCECGTGNTEILENTPSGSVACKIGNTENMNTVSSGWTWNCGADYDAGDVPLGANNGRCENPSICSASCVGVDIDAPTAIYLKKNGNKIDVKVRIENHQKVLGGTCSITLNGGQEETIDAKTETVNGSNTRTIQFDYPESGATIAVSCDLSVDCDGDGSGTDVTITDSQVVRSLCMQKSCNAQGSCQSTPVSATSYDDPNCSSTCNSDADCSRGRMIETRP